MDWITHDQREEARERSLADAAWKEELEEIERERREEEAGETEHWDALAASARARWKEEQEERERERWDEEGD